MAPSSPGSFFRDKKVVVSGGLGFIGSNLTLRLVLEGARVTVIDSSVPGCGANLFNLQPVADQVKVVPHDIGDSARVAPELEGAEVVFNLAGEISHTVSMEHPERDAHLNTIAQLRFLLACRDRCPGVRVVYASTRQIYGRPVYLPVDEAHPVQPIDFNGIHKAAAMEYHLLLSRRKEIDAVVLCLSNVYGPRMALHLPQQGFLGTYVRRGLSGEPIVVYGEGAQTRDPLYAGDAVEALVRAGALPVPQRVYNVGGPKALTVREIAVTTASAGAGGPVVHTEFPEQLRGIDIGSYETDNRAIAADLRWQPEVPFGEGIECTMRYYREHQSHYIALQPPEEPPRPEPTLSKMSILQ
jgi:UDP-glucose 4-epimerase